jgi:hypothetical protein
MTFRSFAAAAASLALALAAGVLAPAPLGAQTTDSTYLTFTAVELRPEASVRSGAESARADEQDAARELDRLKDARTRLEARINVQKADIDALKSRSDLAKRDGRDADRTDLELRRRRADADRKTLEEIRSLFDDQISEMSAKRDWARARGKTYDAELALGRKRQERTERATADSTALGRLDGDIRDLEGKVLDARKDEAARQADWASRYRDTVEQEISVYRAQAAARAITKP